MKKCNFNRLLENSNESLYWIGFILADGHISWLAILKYFSKRFLRGCSAYINNEGYAQLVCSNTSLIKKFKKRVIKLNLPLLERKWDIIDLNYINRNELSKSKVKKVKQLILKNKNMGEISSIIGIGEAGVSLLIKRNKIKYEKYKPGRKSAV